VLLNAHETFFQQSLLYSQNIEDQTLERLFKDMI